jgi:hypothetical protein
MSLKTKTDLEKCLVKSYMCILVDNIHTCEPNQLLLFFQCHMCIKCFELFSSKIAIMLTLLEILPFATNHYVTNLCL